MNLRDSLPKLAFTTSELLKVLCLFALAASNEACGDDEQAPGSCPKTSSLSSAGPFNTPEELLFEGCQKGDLLGFEPDGLWYYEQENRGIFSGTGTVRFRGSCEEGLDVELGSSIGVSSISEKELSDDHLFWRRDRRFSEFDLRVVESYMVCARADNGDYTGRVIRCNITGEGEDCSSTSLKMKPFARLTGETESSGISLVSEFRGNDWNGDFIANVRVHKGRAYLSIADGGLAIVDVSSPESPGSLGLFPAKGEEIFNDLKIVENDVGDPFAILASDERGMVIVDVSDASNPIEVAALTPSGEPGAGIHTVFTERLNDKTIAYLADGYSSVVSYWDVSDPANPLRLGQYLGEDPEWAVHDLFVEDGRMYLNATVGGMVVVDTSEPQSPLFEGRYAPTELSYSHSNWVTTLGNKRVAVHGDEGFDAHFRTVDVDPDSPTYLSELGSYQTRPQVSAHNVMAFGDKAYAAYYQDGVRILDISDPSLPKLEAYFNTWNAKSAIGSRFEGAVGLDLDLDAGLIYVADQPRGLLILRIKQN